MEDLKQTVRDDIYWTLEGYLGKAEARSILFMTFDDAWILYGDSKELYEYYSKYYKDEK